MQGPAGVLLQYAEEPKEEQHSPRGGFFVPQMKAGGTAIDNLCIIRVKARSVLFLAPDHNTTAHKNEGTKKRNGVSFEAK